jgi:hypothetical protein
MNQFDGEYAARKARERANKQIRNRKIKRNIAGAFALLGILTLLVIGGLLILSAVDSEGKASVAKDSGVSACEKMAESVGKNDGNDEPWTEADYHAARMPFESSKHADLKVAGQNVVDAVYELEKSSTDDENLAGALIAFNTVQTRWAGLQTACAAHGVDLPALPTAA